jgi:hypothetical protein
MQASDIPKLRGYFIHKFPETHLFHNHLPDSGFLYRNPSIQYRIIDSHPALIGINEGIELMKRVFLEIDSLRIGGQTIETFEREISLKECSFGQCDNIHSYAFSSPWMALNQENHREYLQMDPTQQKQRLQTILKNNLKTLSKGFNYWIPDTDKIKVDGLFTPVEVNFHNQRMQCFTGEFSTNFIIPEYLALGKQGARGFGVVRKKKEEHDV